LVIFSDIVKGTNKIEDDGAKFLAEALKENATLEKLYLCILLF